MASFKSLGALGHNVQFIAEQFGEMYFWTFTFPVVHDPRDASSLWRDFCRELVRSLGFRGVRVFELHPGGHGLHIHVFTPDFQDVNQVRNIAHRFSFGRLHVERWGILDAQQAASYMCKYVCKDINDWKGFHLKGMRWWATFGMYDKVRVKDVEVDSARRKIWNMLPVFIVRFLSGIPDHKPDDSKAFLMAKMKVCSWIYFGRYDTRDAKWSSVMAICENIRNHVMSLYDLNSQGEYCPL